MLWLINNSKKYLFSSKRSLKFIQLSCLALILTMILTIPDDRPTNCTQNINYSYLTQVFDRSFATTQTDKNVQKHNKNDLGFMISYAPINSTPEFEAIAEKAAFTYDNAVAALAFIALDDRERAKQIVDTLVAAQKRDRFFQDGRIRNTYKGGAFDPESSHFLLPGRYDETSGSWQETEFNVSTHTGNVAWAMLALLGYYESYGGEEYLKSAIAMGEWIEQNCRDRQGTGYTAGYTGWEEQQQKLSYKSTEHNLDLYAAFTRLYLLTGEPAWQERADSAREFVLTMRDRHTGHFWTGTEEDGVTIYREVIPLDAQAWAPLALKATAQSNWQCLKYAQQHHSVKAGFDFNQDRDGVWYEGTAQMALAYQETNQPEKAEAVLAMLKAGQEPSGGMPTSDRNTLTTGFIQPDGNPWLYFRSLHVGATAWTVLAEQGVNPFWLGSKGVESNTSTLSSLD
jgi:3-dehydroquinate dehydratase